MLIKDIKFIFDNELINMKMEGFIDDKTFHTVQQASENYYEVHTQALTNNGSDVDKIQTAQFHDLPKVKQPKVLTEQQKAERKASVLLNLGVIFLFLSGLIFSTTNWDNLGLAGKILSVIFMGSILYSGSQIAYKKLKLEKTGFALWVLTTLYIPVVGLTFVYSLLWNKGIGIGDPLSLISLGIIGIASSLVNLYSFKKYNNKYYLWAFLTTAELSILFIYSSLKRSVGELSLLIVLCSYGVFYIHQKIISEKDKTDLKFYCMALNIITLLVVLFIFKGTEFSIPYITSILLVIILNILFSYKLNDPVTGISLMVFMPVKMFQYDVFYHWNAAVYLIPALIILVMQYQSHKGKFNESAGQAGAVLSFLLFNAAITSNKPFYALGSIGIIIWALMEYKELKLKSENNSNLYIYPLVLIPIYTYILITRAPFLMYHLKGNGISAALGLSAIFLCLIQYAVSDKFYDLKMTFSKVSMLILMINGLNVLSVEWLAACLFLSLSLFEVINLYKKFNPIAYIINCIIGVQLVSHSLTDYKHLNYCSTIVIFEIIIITGVMLILSFINKNHQKYLHICAASLLPIFIMTNGLLFSSSIITIAVMAIAAGLGVLSVNRKESHSLLIISITIALGLFLLIKNNYTGTVNVSVIETAAESMLAVLFSISGFILYDELFNSQKYDSFTFTAIGLIAVFSLNGGYWSAIIVTTLSALILTAINYKKLNNSLLLRLFIVLKLITAYIQLVLLSHISIGEGILIIPLLAWAVCSRFYLFKDKKIGSVFEQLSLIILVLRLLQNVMNFNLQSSLVVITIGIITLVLSYTQKVKDYFLTSLAMIILPLIKGTLDFWKMIPWWAYLLIVGIILIAMGSMVEKNKKDNKSFKDYTENLFNGWR